MKNAPRRSKKSKKSKKSRSLKSKKVNNPYLDFIHGKNKKSKKLRDYFIKEYQKFNGKPVGKQALEQQAYVTKKMAFEWNKLKENI